jgi:ring-1,2-phenylacetyl-CoA epoxidase subunit PaaD
MVATDVTEARVWELLEEVLDPEVPVLSILDLGIVRGVQVAGEQVTVHITPTYSGCPAMNTIATDIRLRLLAEGITQVTIHNQLSPAWTTDWMTPAGREKLEAYGIAPPVAPIASPIIRAWSVSSALQPARRLTSATTATSRSITSSATS